MAAVWKLPFARRSKPAHMAPMDHGKRQVNGRWDILLTARLHGQQRRWAIAVIGAFVALTVGICLMTPALSMTRGDATCGLEAHTHDASCYEPTLICQEDESGGHEHGEDCYDQILTCGLEEHTHTDACYGSEAALAAVADSLEEGDTETHAARDDEAADEDLGAGEYESADAEDDEASEHDDVYAGDVDDLGADGADHADAADPDEETANTESPDDADAASTDDADEENPDMETGDPENPRAENPDDADTAGVDDVDGESSDSAAAEGAPDTDAPDTDAPDTDMPACKFGKDLKDKHGDVIMTVAVEAPEGAFPKGTEMQVSRVQADDVREKIEAAFEEDGRDASEVGAITAVNISFFNADKQEIEPAKKVEVRIASDVVRDAEDIVLVHIIDQDKTNQQVEPDPETGETPEAEIVPYKPADISDDCDTIVFKSDAFSAYAIVEGPEAIPLGWARVSSIGELIELGSEGLYLGHPNGYYFTNGITDDGSRVGITKTKPAQNFPSDKAALYYFEQVDGSENQVYAYCYNEDGTARQYLFNSGNNNSLSFTTEENKTAFTVTKNGNGTFKFNNGAWYWNMQGGDSGLRFCSYNNANDGNNNLYLWRYITTDRDPYGLDGKTHGLMNWNGGVAGKALMAERSTENRLDAKSLPVMSTANNSKHLFVPNDSDATMWTFHWASGDTYYLAADGDSQYLKIDATGASLVSTQAEASPIQVVPGTGAHAGEICLKSGGATLTFSGTVEGGYTVNGEVGNEWLNLVEPSELTTDYFLTYSAEKVSVSDKDITNGSRVIVYTRSWNTEALRYDYYAIGSDGAVVRVYESGDSIEWVSGQINTLLWNFTEYYWEGTTDPNFYYELYNQYSQKFLAPQLSGNQTLSSDPIGINLNGRRDGQYYSSILAWDEQDYSYVGLKVENGQIVSCPKSEAMDFYFAIMQDVNVDDTLNEVKTIDHTQYGVTMKIKDFATRKEMSDFLGNDEGGATLSLQQGLLSTNLVDGYPSAKGGSLGSLFEGATEVNHLFIEGTYGESGYYEYDSAQNFASLKGDTQDGDGIPDFVVYRELGSYDSGGNKNTLKHGQFLPFNDLKPGTFASANGMNLYSSTGARLPDGDARKYERLYSVEHDGEKANTYFGVELEASFTQTPSGEDAWGHDIIFEFTGDDDFWLYVDGELVIDLGGIHSAVPGSVNFRTGAVNVNGTKTTLRELFYANYLSRDGNTEEDAQAYVDGIFVQNDDGQWVFKDDTAHTMNIFYMERGAGASNLHMRFNLAAVKAGTAKLSKTLEGVDEGNIEAEFPYQILYKTSEEEGAPEHYLTNAISGSTQNDDYVYYEDSVNPVKYRQSLDIAGKTYQDVFFLKPGETADISFPEGTTSYRVVECGVDTNIYSTVKVNRDEIEGTEVSDGSMRKDFGIDYATTDQRARVNYANVVNPDALRTLTIQKKLYREDGVTEIPSSENDTEFSFRLYLASEYGDLDAANMHAYHVKDPQGNYCRWDAKNQEFVAITDEDDRGIKVFSALSSAQKAAASFTTSVYGTIGKIRTGYTVEVRDVLAGTQYRVEERPGEVPDGYSFQRYEGYDSQNASISEQGNTGVKGVVGRVVSGADAPVVVRNLKGWGLRVNKVWRDAEYMADRAPTYFALFTSEEGALRLVPDSVRQLAYGARPQTIYWYYDHLPVEGTSGVGDYLVREVTLSSSNPTVGADGVVGNYGDVTPIPDVEGENTLELTGRLKGEQTDSTFTYSVIYEPGTPAPDSNVRVDAVTNDRPGIVLKKQDWNGEALAGATFALKDGETVLGTFTSDADGFVTTAFLSDNKRYSLVETKAPQGYHGIEEDMTIWADADGTIHVAGLDKSYYELVQAHGTDLATVTIKNRPFTFQAVKRDADNDNAPLQGITFELHKQVTVGGVTAIDLSPMSGFEALVTDAQGAIPQLDNALAAGTYELWEKTTPGNYEALGHVRFTISPTGAITLGAHPDGVTLAQGGNANEELRYVLTVLNYRKKTVSFKKVDVSNTSMVLGGAVFDLYPTHGGIRAEAPMISGLTSRASDGLLVAGGKTTFALEPGVYHLIETEAPAEYNLREDPVVVTVYAATAGADAVTYTDGTTYSQGDGKSYDPVAHAFTLAITNTGGYELPVTGGPGTDILSQIGFAFIALSLGLFLARRVRRAGRG